MSYMVLQRIGFVLLITLFPFIVTADSLMVKPNIVLILIDDGALMDLGCYGGEAKTPNIDQLARNGTMFTHFHTSPMCAPSRAMLLTGYDSHLTGVPNLPLFLPPEYAVKEGYKGILNNKVKTIGTRLKNNGYRTYVTGKWHLGHTENTLPSKRGFDRTYILDASGADNYEHKAYLPTQSKPPWFEDGQPIDLPTDFYSSRNLVDKMIEFQKQSPNDGQPFFSYLAFQAIHIPVQAPKAFIDKYEGVYDEGWAKIKQTRFEKAKTLGLIPPKAKVGDMLPVLKDWEILSEEEKKFHAKTMAVNAGMLEAMDFHVGRYIEYLKQAGKFDNTVFIVTSDNGPEASDPSQVAGMNLWLKSVGYHRDFDKLGERGSWNFIGPEFASAAAGPSAFFKFHAGEGGIRVPLIFSGKNIPARQSKKPFSMVTDIVPTILDIANVSKTDTEQDPQFTGKSLVPVLQNKAEIVYQPDEPIGLEAAAQSALFKGDMKLVKNGRPFGDGVWRMYNLATDPGETVDLAASEPALFKILKADYAAYCTKYGVLEMPASYGPILEVQAKFQRKIMTVLKPILLIGLALLGYYFFRRRRKRQLMENSGDN